MSNKSNICESYEEQDFFPRCKTKPQIYFNAEELDTGTMPLLFLVGQTPRSQAAR